MHQGATLVIRMLYTGPMPTYERLLRIGLLWTLVFVVVGLLGAMCVWTFLHVPPPSSYVPSALSVAALTTIALYSIQRGLS